MGSNEEYKRGYNYGYDYVRYEGGRSRDAYRELMNRGIPIRSPYGVGFIHGAKDAAAWVERRY